MFLARKIKKNPPPIPIKQHPKYRVAIYARLSKEDNGINGGSIKNQVDLLTNFVNDSEDLTLVQQFIDNGQTGTNFERTAFIQMMDAIQKGEINCIVVKDLSRFGRNYIETGTYIERILPFFGVRFIAITDNLDTNHLTNNGELLMALKSIINSSYAKDISIKVSSAIDVKKKSGKFMGKIPPYGYLRSADDKYKLEINEKYAVVVQRIFKMRLDGIGVTAIARKLNDENIPSQMKLRFLEGYSDGKESALWHGSSIIAILENYYYIGCTVERKSKTHLYKLQEVIPQDEWNYIKDTHEAIVSEADFFAVQDLIRESKKNNSISPNEQNTENIFVGILECGCCGSKLVRSSGYFKKKDNCLKYSFYCSRKYIKNGGCNQKSIDETDLKNIVTQILTRHIQLLAEDEELKDSIILQNLNNKLCKQLIKKIVVHNGIVSVHFNFDNIGGKINDWNLSKVIR